MPHLVCPADVPELTGGSLYNRRLIAHAPQIEYARPAAGELASFLAQLERGAYVIVDSIYFERGADFDALLEAASRSRLILLAHYRPSQNPNLTPDQRTRLRARERELANRAERVIATSAYLRASWLELGLEPDKVRVCTPAVELAFRRSDGSARRVESRRSILTVGSLVPEKGQLELLEYLEPFAARIARWTIVGGRHDHGYAERLEHAIANSKLRAQTVVTGPLEPNRLPQLLAGASVFALATHYESYSMAIAEALAAGVPVLANDVGGVSELVEHGSSGLLCDLHDRAAWHTALARMLLDDQAWRALAEGAARKGASLPTWQDVAARFMQQIAATST